MMFVLRLHTSDLHRAIGECGELRSECEELQYLVDELRAEVRQQKEHTDQQRIRALDLKFELKEVRNDVVVDHTV